jgi:5-(carboxyamino)imidazole ribonucleotide mutase
MIIMETTPMSPAVRVGIVMGSDSDWPVMQAAAEALQELGIGYEVEVISAHRTPQRAMEYASTAEQRGLQVLIAGAGGAAHLPGVLAALTVLPVIGVPIRSPALQGLDSLYSIVQMPSGVPVATVAIDGARNAGLLAAQILGVGDPTVRSRLHAFKNKLAQSVEEKAARIRRGSLEESAGP